jgi:hypothetical protein
LIDGKSIIITLKDAADASAAQLMYDGLAGNHTLDPQLQISKLRVIKPMLKPIIREKIHPDVRLLVFPRMESQRHT